MKKLSNIEAELKKKACKTVKIKFWTFLKPEFAYFGPFLTFLTFFINFS